MNDTITAKIKNIVWEDDAPSELPTEYEMNIELSYIQELQEYDKELSENDIVERVIYEDLPTICSYVDDCEYEVISFDFEIE
jgi:hypothetical protein